MPGRYSCACCVSVSERFWRTNRRTPSSSSSRLIWWLIAVCVTFSSEAARVKLKCRAAASKARNPFSDGSLEAILYPHIMTLTHLKRYKVSFVERSGDADISQRTLAAGAENVHFEP